MASVKAYLDSFSGLVPCIILEWTPYRHDYKRGEFGAGFVVKYTAERGAYKRGNVEWWPVSRIVPRSAVVTRSGQYRIMPYSWPDLAPKLFKRESE
jgi:hypothetical protein